MHPERIHSPEHEARRIGLGFAIVDGIVSPATVELRHEEGVPGRLLSGGYDALCEAVESTA